MIHGIALLSVHFHLCSLFPEERYRISIWIYACPPLHPSISVKIWKVWRIWRIWKPTFSPWSCYLVPPLVGYYDFIKNPVLCNFSCTKKLNFLESNINVLWISILPSESGCFWDISISSFPLPPLSGSNFIPFLAAYIRIAIRVRPTTSNIPITTLWCRHCPSQNGRCTRGGGIQMGRVKGWCTDK